MAILPREITRVGGFSLIELMVVLAIGAILAAVAVPAYFNHLMRSRQTAVVGELMSIKAAEERYFAEHGNYTGKLNNLDKYAGSTVYSNGYYQYWAVPDTSALIPGGTIMAKGDLNGDGQYNDRWQLSIQDIAAKPQHDDTGSNEGFTWSSLASLFK